MNKIGLIISREYTTRVRKKSFILMSLLGPLLIVGFIMLTAYLKKGNSVYIEGKLRTRSWEDKNGETRYTTEVFCDKLELLGKKSDNENNPSNIASAEKNPSDEPGDNLPF
mgnify:CR=1 FL=1